MLYMTDAVVRGRGAEGDLAPPPLNLGFQKRGQKEK